MDTLGDHRAACSTCGILGLRGRPLEIAAARVCREAGARVQENVMLRDMNVEDISADDTRKIEVVANGLPLHHGAQLAIDTTLVSPLRRDGSLRRTESALADARKRKEDTYPEFVESRRCRLVVLGMEVGGRWSEEAAGFVWSLAQAKARSVPRLLRRSAEHANYRRWTCLLAYAAMSAFAASLLEEPLAGASNVAGDEHDLAWVLTETRCEDGPDPSRLPAQG